jgi:hypothetical protein
MIEEEIEGIEKDIYDGQRAFDWSILSRWQLVLPKWFLDKGPFKRPRRHDQHCCLQAQVSVLPTRKRFPRLSARNCTHRKLNIPGPERLVVLKPEQLGYPHREI